MRISSRLRRSLIAPAAASLALGGCASTIERAPFTETEQAGAVDVDIAGARRWADERAEAFAPVPPAAGSAGAPVVVLAVSGGGENGAFGAGLLNGWSATGRRPEFTIVTGVSTGALIAPFAFLGPAYDPQLKAVYTETDTKDVLRSRGVLAGLFGSSFADSSPLAGMIAGVITPAFLDAVAREHARGRRLYVMTTNLDAGRAVIWDMGAIASSSSPRRVPLFRSVLLASASIPGAFPPVLIEARAGGRTIREMHADGGATAQIIALPEAILAQGRVADARPLELYLIVNSRIDPQFALTKERTASILGRALSSLLRSGTRASLLGVYNFADRNGYPLRVATIMPDFKGEPARPFENAYMRRLFAYGFERSGSGAAWTSTLPAKRAEGGAPPAR